MNKLLTKIVGAALGLSMTVGVGVAVASNQNKSIHKADALTGAHEDFELSSASSVTQGAVTVSFSANGGTSPAWYAAGLRLYAKNKVTITGTSNIVGVEFNWEKQGSKDFATATASTGSYTHPSQTGVGTWTGNAASVVFTLGSSGQLQLNTFSVYYESSDVEVTISGSDTVAEGHPETYSCNAGVTATWTLENVSPAGCATISGSTVTAHQTGTAKLVCTPSTAGYVKSSKNLTITASIKHNVIAEGTYFINAGADVPSISNGSMLKPEAVNKSPVAIAPDFSSASLAWTIENNDTTDNAYTIKSGSLYLVGSDDSEGISITTTAPGSDKYWTISSHGADSNGNIQYRFHYVDGGNRYMALYAGASSNSFRSYAYDSSRSNYDFNLIPVSRTMTAITVGGTLSKTSYDQNDYFDATGAKVTGAYSNGYGDAAVAYLDETQNANLSWTPSHLTTTGSVNVYAVIGEITSTNYFTVTVTETAVPVTGVSVSPSSHTFEYVEIGTTQQLTETISPSNASNKNVTWSSNNESVATVTATGLVTAVGVGNATITVTTVNGGFTATCSIIVNAFAGEYHKVTDTSKLYAGMKFALVYEGGSKIAGPIANTKTFLSSEDATVAGGEASSSSETVFTLGGTVNNWTLTTSQGLLYATAAKALEFDSVVEGADSTWTITISSGNVFITSNTAAYGTIKYNTSSPRFLNYASGQTAIQMYAADHEDNIYAWISNNMRMGDTALTSEQDTGTCKSTGNDYYLTAKTALASLSGSERSAFENNTGSKYTEALKRYKAWASACGDKQPFNGGTSIVLSSRTSLLGSASDSANAAVIITIVSVISLSAVAGFFLLRKRKEQ